MDRTLIRVGIGDARFGKAPDSLTTILGSCVAVCLFDRRLRTGAMAHVMLDYSNGQQGTPGKYADTAVPLVVNVMMRNGSSRGDLFAKISGGAKMYNIKNDLGMLNIGDRNREAVERFLHELKVPVRARDLGGTSGRSVIMDLENFTLAIRATKGGQITI